MKKAIFWDRDGTLNEERKYLSDPDALVLFAGLPQALKQLQDAGYHHFIVTNQSGIGRGYYSEADMHRVNERLAQMLAPKGILLQHIYFAPESPDQPSRGRKPSAQFLWDARDTYGVNLHESFMVGDKLSDLQCGWNAGVRQAFLVQTGYGQETLAKITEEQRAQTVVLPHAAALADWVRMQVPEEHS